MQSKQASLLLAESVRRSLALDTLEPSRGPASNGIRELRKKLTLGRAARPIALRSAILTLCAYGHYERTVEASELLGTIDPDTWDIDYGYVGACIKTSYFFAARADDASSMARLSVGLNRPANIPAPLIMSGKLLDLPFERIAQPPYPLPIENSLAFEALNDIGRLAAMWIFGGSDEWPRERIMAQVDSTIENLHNLKGWEPW